MNYGLIVFDKTENLGDDIQSYATEQFLPHTDYILERERLDEFCSKDGAKVACILSGWYLYDHLHWPPSPFLYTKPISMHFDTSFSKFAGEDLTRNFVLEDYGAEWLIKNGPIGCRDKGTMELLEEKEIPAYISGCLTLTLKPYNDVESNDKICLVDVSSDVKKYVGANTNKEICELTHSIKMEGVAWEERRKIVEERLRIYQGAHLVITTRLHVALPCLALGTPVLLIKEAWSLNRTGYWLDYINYTTEENFISGAYSYNFDIPKENPNKHYELVKKMELECREFISQMEKTKETYLDMDMFLEGKKRINRLQKLMTLRIEKYENELNMIRGKKIIRLISKMLNPKRKK